MDAVSDKDKFQYWLMEMDDAIEVFINSLPPDVAKKFNYSPDSLLELEAQILDRYKTIDQVRPASEAQYVDGAARYLGEVFRKKLGGKWSVDFSDPANVFYGLPQIVDFPGQETQVCPQRLVVASADRQKGNYFHTILSNLG